MSELDGMLLRARGLRQHRADMAARHREDAAAGSSSSPKPGPLTMDGFVIQGAKD